MRMGAETEQARAVTIKPDVIDRMAQELNERAQDDQHERREHKGTSMVPPDRGRRTIYKHVDQAPRIAD
jgi:hypothetical protein